MDKYCEEHEEGQYCKLTNRLKANGIFCEMICKGNYKDFYIEDVEVVRTRLRKSLTEESFRNKDRITVIIPSYQEDTKMIQRTVDSLIENSVGLVDIYVIHDGCDGENIKGATTWYCSNRVGQRVIYNIVAGQTESKYLMRMDGHCLMSPEWDARMKESCKEGVLVTTCFDSLDDDFKPQGRDNAFVILRKSMTNRFGRGWKSFEDRQLEEETMAITGTAFIVNRSDYERLGCDERYGGWGGIGAEWSLKFWLTGGRVIIRTDVVCYHYYRKKTPYKINMTQKNWALRELYRQYVQGENKMITRPIEWLLYHFSHYVRWPNANL